MVGNGILADTMVPLEVLQDEEDPNVTAFFTKQPSPARHQTPSHGQYFSKHGKFLITLLSCFSVAEMSDMLVQVCLNFRYLSARSLLRVLC